MENSKTNPANPAAPPKNPVAKRTQRRKNISLDDAERLADLTENQRLNYGEALAILGICRNTWESWVQRARNTEKYASIVMRVRGAYIKGRLANIGDAETGRNGHRPDWRASKALLEIVSPERYLPRQPLVELPKPAVSEATINVWLAAAYNPASPTPPAAAIVDTEAKLLPETTTPAEPPPALQPGPGMEDWLGTAPPASEAPRRTRSKRPPMFPTP